MISVGFTRRNKLDIVSRLIMWFLNTKYSHCFFILDGVIYHADGKGVRHLNLDKYLETHIMLHEIPVDLDITEKEFLMFMEGANKKDYSESQYLGFLFTWLQPIVANGEKRQICSELVSLVLDKYGAYELPKAADFMSPRDVFELITKQNPG